MAQTDTDAELLHEFKAEALEHLGEAEPLLLLLEGSTGDTQRQYVHTVFRAVHSIKGVAGLLDLRAMEQISHAVESLLMPVRDGKAAYSATMTDVLLAALDSLRRCVEALPRNLDMDTAILVGAIEAAGGALQGPVAVERNAFAGLTTSIPPTELKEAQRLGHNVYWLVVLEPCDEKDAKAQELAATIQRLGRLVGRRPGRGPVEAIAVVSPLDKHGLSGELNIDVANFHEVGGQVVEAKPASDVSPESIDTLRVKTTLLNQLMNLASQLVLSRNELVTSLEGREEFESPLKTLSLVTSEMRAAVMSTRLQNVGSLFRRLNRLVHDVGKKLGKDVALFGEGLDVELDRSIIEALSDPLNHLVRNALDHGFETPQERIRAGKSAQGSLLIKARHEGGIVTLDVRDDGKGMDPERIKEVALERGVATAAQLQGMDSTEILNLVFLPGFSTAREVTDLSGRGVGMDVVKTNIYELGGKLDLFSEPGKGTLVRICLPMTLAILPGLVLRLRQQRFVVAQMNLVEVVRVTAAEVDEHITVMAGARLLRLRGDYLPLLMLADLLESPNPQAHPPPPVQYVLVLRAGEQNLGLAVDAVEDNQEIVVKPLVSLLKGCQIYAGTTILGDGTVAMILDVNRIAALAQLVAAPPTEQDTNAVEPQVTQEVLLFASSAEERFGVDLRHVKRVLRINQEDIASSSHEEFYKLGESPMRLVRFCNLVAGQPLNPSSPVYYAIEPRGGDGQTAWLVDRLIDAVRLQIPPGVPSEASAVLGRMVLDDELVTFVDIPTLIATEVQRHA